MHFTTSSREGFPRKWHMKSTWLEAEESCQAINFARISQVRPSHEVVAKHSARRFFYVWLAYPSPMLYIPSLPTHVKEANSKRKTLDRFSTTHTHLLERELLILSEKSLSHSSLVRNHCSIFSFPLPLSYVERRFVPKHNSHLLRV